MPFVFLSVLRARNCHGVLQNLLDLHYACLSKDKKYHCFKVGMFTQLQLSAYPVNHAAVESGAIK
jgi:hypothetical protein